MKSGGEYAPRLRWPQSLRPSQCFLDAEYLSYDYNIIHLLKFQSFELDIVLVAHRVATNI